MSKADKLREVHERALKHFNAVYTSQIDERKQCLEDRRFYSIAGAAWEGALQEQFENKPKFESNKILQAVIRIFNDYKNNKIDIRFQSKDGAQKDDLAETCTSLLRGDEQSSGADEAYDNCFEEGASGGMGAWRIRACYEDEDDEDATEQRIKIEPIYEADTCVFFGLEAKRYDKADAKRCWVISSIPRGDYEDEYNDDPASWSLDMMTEFDWATPDVVYIAEYYEIKEERETLHFYRGLDGTERKVCASELQDDDALEDDLAAAGYREVRRKTIKQRKVHKYLLSGGGVIEDCGVIAGKHIPIVPYYGKRWYINNIERCMGHVRPAKDPSRLKNMQLSKLAELSAMSSVEKPVFFPQQMLGLEELWANDSIDNRAYLLKNPMFDAMGQLVPVPTEYTRAPQIPPAMATLLQITEQDLKDILGNQPEREGIVSNISGKAVELIQSRLDMQSFIYIANFAKSKKRGAEIWLSMAKELFVEEGRKVKGIDDSGKASQIELMRPEIDDKGNFKLANDVSEADFEVFAEVGPSSSSKKEATIRNLMSMMQITKDPETLEVLSASAMMNMEGEGISKTQDYFRRKLIRLGVQKPTDEEAKALQDEMANIPPDVNNEFLRASAEQAQAQAIKARADTVLIMAKAKDTEAKTLETLAGMDLAQRKQLVEMINMLGDKVGSEATPLDATQQSGNPQTAQTEAISGVTNDSTQQPLQ